MPDPSLVFLDGARDAQSAGTHVLIIGAGFYEFGKRQNGPASIIDDLPQLTSPSVSARAMADWFIGSFHNHAKHLRSVSLLIAEEAPRPYRPPARADATNRAPWTRGQSGTFLPPQADLAGVNDAAAEWAKRLHANEQNLAVFYFCGHGISSGTLAAMLLRDFGKPGHEFEGAIDLNVLLGAMHNSKAVQQLFLLDCCRTAADDLYENQQTIGSRIVSLPARNRGRGAGTQQFVLFPTLDGEEAFGIRNETSVFSRSLIDAFDFAAADFSTGHWVVSTGNLLGHVDRLVRARVPPSQLNRSKPNAPNATHFEIHEIAALPRARTIVSLSDSRHWPEVVRLECREPATGTVRGSIDARASDSDRCGRFEVDEGRWIFSGVPRQKRPVIKDCDQHVLRPVGYVTLDVEP